MSWGELAGLIKVVPLSTIPTHAGAERSRFSASMWSTRALLEREIDHLSPREVLLEADFRPGQLRLDGLPKADSRPGSPAVVLTLRGTPHGDLRYPCSTFTRWEDNLRAVALSLEALRAVSRYGVVKRGEQYVGSKQLESGSSDGNVERGRTLIRRAGGVAEALKAAAAHPDHGGDVTDFRDVMAAKEAGLVL